VTGLLVSVRDADEAEVALHGGATLIDIKEPGNGSLGRADTATISAIVERVARRVPVSAAMGELQEEAFDVPRGVVFAKWGLAKCQGFRWQDRLDALRRQHIGVEVVTVAYADWECAAAPSIEEVLDYACERGGVFLIDTCCKEPTGFRPRPTLLDWADETWLAQAVARCRASTVRIALAGSLNLDAIRRLTVLCPDWFAVRGAACEGGARTATVSRTQVGRLVEALQGTSHR